MEQALGQLLAHLNVWQLNIHTSILCSQMWLWSWMWSLVYFMCWSGGVFILIENLQIGESELFKLALVFKRVFIMFTYLHACSKRSRTCGCVDTHTHSCTQIILSIIGFFLQMIFVLRSMSFKKKFKSCPNRKKTCWQRLNTMIGDNIAQQVIYKEFLRGRSFLNGNLKGFQHRIRVKHMVQTDENISYCQYYIVYI